jgi:hypothetical protein
MKLDLSGNILWQKTLGSAGTELGYTLTLDSSENVIISAYNVDDILIIKYNSSGTLQWQRKFGKVKVGTYDNEFAPSVAVDSSDNIYIVGYSITESIGFFGETTYLFDGVIAKYNSSGVIQWQKKVTSASGSYVQFYGITIDLNNNLYITGGCTVDIGAYRYPVYVAKLNSSGVVQWQRGLYRASTSSVSYALINYGYSISFDEYEDLCIVGTTTYSSTGIYNKYYPLAFKVPSDGSLTGDYGVFRYGSVSLTYSNGTYADSATTFTDSSSTFSLTNSTLTDSASSCSYDNLIEMPDNSEKLSISIEEIMPTNGLVNYLNVANRNSYPGSGTTWYDLSGNNRNGTISGSYSDGSLFFNPGYVEFSQYNFGNEFTFIAFINPTTKNTISALFANSSAGSFTNGIRIFINFDGANTRTLHIELGNGSSSQLITSASNTVTYGVWQQVAFTLNKSTAKGAIYHNGIKVKEDNLNFTNFNSNDRFDFGTIRGAYSYLGRLSSFTTYNRALTESEIKDIYKLRYSNENGLSIFNLNI